MKACSFVFCTNCEKEILVSDLCAIEDDIIYCDYCASQIHHCHDCETPMPEFTCADDPRCGECVHADAIFEEFENERYQTA